MKREKARRLAALLALEAAENYACMADDRVRARDAAAAQADWSAAIEKIAAIFVHAPGRAFDDQGRAIEEKP